MKTTMNLILAAAAAMALLAAGALLDGPSDDDLARATAADLADAKLAAQRFDRDLRACKRAMGPTADLIEIERTGNYVCRLQDIEPTPAEILHRYANLTGRTL